MKSGNREIGKSGNRLLRAFLYFTISQFPNFPISTSAAPAADIDDGFFRYQTILDKNLFGRGAPALLVADNFSFPDNAADTPGEVVDLATVVRLVALSKFQGVPAAGLVDIRTGRTAYLLEGQSMGDFTLESVSYQNSSVVVSKGTHTNEIVMTYGQGQASNLTASDDSPYLSVLNVRNKNSSDAAMLAAADSGIDLDGLELDDLNATNTAVAVAAAAPAAPAAAGGSSQFTAAEIAAATIVDENGESRISYRLLQEIRVQRERDRVEAERRDQEARLAAERARREQLAKDEADRAAAAKLAADTQNRRAAIEALKAGDETVVINFELTNAEKRELAQAGYDIPGFNDEEIVVPVPPATDGTAPPATGASTATCSIPATSTCSTPAAATTASTSALPTPSAPASGLSVSPRSTRLCRRCFRKNIRLPVQETNSIMGTLSSFHTDDSIGSNVWYFSAYLATNSISSSTGNGKYIPLRISWHAYRCKAII